MTVDKDREWQLPQTPADLATALEHTGYLSDEGIATAAFLALRMHRPLFCEGEPGTGKTALAQALAQALDVPLIRLQCHEGIDAGQALYDWDFPRQLLHLRTIEASSTGGIDVEAVESSLYTRRFLLARPLLPGGLAVRAARRRGRPRRRRVRGVPARGALRARGDGAGVRRGAPREVAILRRRLPELTELLARQVSGAVHRMRAMELLKPPGVAESLDWAEALIALGRTELDAAATARTLGAVLKYREDADRVGAAGLDAILAS